MQKGFKRGRPVENLSCCFYIQLYGDAHQNSNLRSIYFNNYSIGSNLKDRLSSQAGAHVTTSFTYLQGLIKLFLLNNYTIS